MRAYTIRRLLLVIPTLFLVTVIVFLTVRLIPGNVVDMMVESLMSPSGGGGGCGVEIDREKVERMLGLDVPIQIQYIRWMGFVPTPDPDTGESRYNGIFQGNFGDSIWMSTTVVNILSKRLPVTIELGILAIVIAVSMGLPIGVWSAIRQDTVSDYVGRTISITGLAIPSFWIATMLMVYPSILWGWSPPMEYIHLLDDPMGNLGMNLLPAFLMAMVMSAITMRMTRTMMLEVLRQDYIRTAWSKGLRERVVVIRHAMKNALIPVVTMIGMQLPVLIGGTVIIEQIFNFPGIGRLLVEAIGRRDYAIISGVNLMIAGFVLINNLLIDLTYAYLDPRLRYR